MSSVELWSLGQSGFRLRDPENGTVLYIDPFLSPHRGRTWQAPLGPAQLAEADAVLCTHEHADHFDREALRAANEVPGARFQLMLPAPIADQGRALGIPTERILPAQPNETYQVGNARVHPVPARHGVHVSDAYNFGRALSGGLIRYLGFVVEIGAVCLYHAGDTARYDGQVELLRTFHPQIELLPINGRDALREAQDIVGNLNEEQAAQLAHDTGAQVIVPMHWDIFGFNRGSPNELVAYVERYEPQLTVLVFGRGERLVYDSVQPALVR